MQPAVSAPLDRIALEERLEDLERRLALVENQPRSTETTILGVGGGVEPPPYGREGYVPHGEAHEAFSGDAVRLSVQNNGTQLNRQRTLNFTTGLTATEDSTNKRITVAAAAVAAFSGARAYHSGTQAVGIGGTWLSFDSELFDAGSYHTTTGSLTVPATGYYLIGAFVLFGASTAINLEMHANSRSVRLAGIQTSGSMCDVHAVSQLTAGWAVEVFTSCSPAATLQAGSTANGFWIARLG